MPTTQDLEHLRYPVGPMPRSSAPLDARAREEYFAVLESTPARIRSLVTGLTGIKEFSKHFYSGDYAF